MISQLLMNEFLAQKYFIVNTGANSLCHCDDDQNLAALDRYMLLLGPLMIQFDIFFR